MVSWIDGVVVGAYILLIFLLAWRSGRNDPQKESPETQYLANRSLSFAESICSIIATEVSALTFLGIPAFAFRTDFNFLQIYMGAFFARIVIALVFLPRVYGQGLTIYEVMAGKHETGGRRAVGLFFTIGKIVAVGVRLLSGTILVASFLHVPMYLGLVFVTFVTFLYTLMGGLKAVVRADMLQLGLFVSGGVLAHILIPQVAESSWGELMGLAEAAGKTRIFDWTSPGSILAGVLGGVLFDMSTHGVDQDFAQRTTGSASLRKGQLAIFLSSFLSISVGLLFLSVGALLWAFYQSHPLPAAVPNADHLFAHFIVTYFPTGIRGLMVAGALAATMSTMDSVVNALCATIYNDILPRRRGKPLAHYFFRDNLAITVLLFGIALTASQSEGLLLLGLKIQSWTGGALLALFLSRIVFKETFPYTFSTTSVVGAYAFGIAGVATNTLLLQANWNWNTYFGCGFALAFLWALSRLKPGLR
jgi:SSS family solute:Na+ symporter